MFWEGSIEWFGFDFEWIINLMFFIIETATKKSEVL